MRRIPSAASVADAPGVTLDVDGRRRPRLELRVATGGRLLLSQNERPVLLAFVDDDRSGIEYLSTGEFQSPVAPLRAAHAEAVGADRGSAWAGRWLRHFAAALEAGDGGPLHDGRWLLDPRATRLEHTPWARTVAL